MHVLHNIIVNSHLHILQLLQFLKLVLARFAHFKLKQLHGQIKFQMLKLVQEMVLGKDT